MSAQMTASELLDSLTGFDEIAIEKAFGKTLDEMGQRDLARALIFVKERRFNNLPDAKAREVAMSLPMGQLDDQFAPSENEPMPEEPVTAEGEGDSAA